MAAAAMADTRTVTIRLQQLTEHLGCVLCRGMLRDAHTIPECLHSFCKSCIFRYFLLQCDLNEPSCPKCHARLSARPIATLISDQRLQDVVDRIFPEHKERDAVLEEEFYARHQFAKKSAASSSDSSPASAAVQAASVPSAAGTTDSYTDSTTAESSALLVSEDAVANLQAGATASAASAAPASSPSPSPTVADAPAPASSSRLHKRSLKLVQTPLMRYSTPVLRLFTIEVYPDASCARVLPALRRPFLHVDGRFKMFELRKCIAKWLEALAHELEITCLGAIVGPELSVHFIHRTIWQHRHEGKRLVLQYRHMTS